MVSRTDARRWGKPHLQRSNIDNSTNTREKRKEVRTKRKKVFLGARNAETRQDKTRQEEPRLVISDYCNGSS